MCSLTHIQRLACKVLKVVDVSYGGENGFNQAIELSGKLFLLFLIAYISS